MRLYSFSEFVNEQKSNEEHQLLLEAFNSSIIQKIASNKKGGIGKEFFDTLSKMGIAASEVTNADIEVLKPEDAERYAKQNVNAILIYYSEKPKENPYASAEAWNKKIEGDVVLAVVKGKLFMGLAYDRWATKAGGKAEYKVVPEKDAGRHLGAAEKSGGKYGSGLTTLKKMADVSDVVYVIDPTNSPSTLDLRATRVEQKKGAAAFVDDKQFKKENQARYEAILRQRAAGDDIDGLVQDAIDELTNQIKDALKAGGKTQYGEILIGSDPKGRDVKMSDATSLMSRILDYYGRYVSAKQSAKTSEERHGIKDDYYAREAATKAKDVKDNCNKIKNLNYAW